MKCKNCGKEIEKAIIGYFHVNMMNAIECKKAKPNGKKILLQEM